MAQHLKFAKDAFTISGGGGLYDRARPSYPKEALAKLASLIPIQAAHIVELGSGTGIFTRNLLEALSPEQLGHLTCVEPSEGMRNAFEKGIAQHPLGDKVECVDGVFDSIPVPDASVDLVVVAQAWHWTGKEQAKPTAEVARVLKKGGKLALIWNLEDRETAPWVAKLRDAYEKYEQGTPQYRLGWWKAMFDTAAYKDNFEPATKYDYVRNLETTRELAIDRVFSKSYIAVLPDDEKEQLRQELVKLIDNDASKRWFDQERGIFEYPYRTDLWVMEKK